MSGTDDSASRLRKTIDRAVPMLEKLNESSASVTAEGKWSAKEVIGHLIDSACNNHRRFVIAQGRDDLLFEGYDQEHWVRAQRYKEESWQALVSLWQAYNRHLAWVIEGIASEELSKPRSVHSLDRIAWKVQRKEEPVTLGFLASDYIDHLENHLRQILPEYQ